jgi:hypothetical protein
MSSLIERHRQGIQEARRVFADTRANNIASIDKNELNDFIKCRGVIIPLAIAPISLGVGLLSYASLHILNKRRIYSSSVTLRAVTASLLASLYFFNGTKDSASYTDACYINVLASDTSIGRNMRSAYKRTAGSTPFLIAAEEVSQSSVGRPRGPSSDKNHVSKFGDRVLALMPSLQATMSLQSSASPVSTSKLQSQPMYPRKDDRSKPAEMNQATDKELVDDSSMFASESEENRWFEDGFSDKSEEKEEKRKSSFSADQKKKSKTEKVWKFDDDEVDERFKGDPEARKTEKQREDVDLTSYEQRRRRREDLWRDK